MIIDVLRRAVALSAPVQRAEQFFPFGVDAEHWRATPAGSSAQRRDAAQLRVALLRISGASDQLSV